MPRPAAYNERSFSLFLSRMLMRHVHLGTRSINPRTRRIGAGWLDRRARGSRYTCVEIIIAILMMKSLVAGRLGGKNLALRVDYVRYPLDRKPIDVRPPKSVYISFIAIETSEESGIRAANYVHIFMVLCKFAAKKGQIARKQDGDLQL